MRAAPLGFGALFDGDAPLMTLVVERRAGQVTEAANAGHTVTLPGGGGDGLAYGLRLLGTKGRSARHRWSSNSLSIVSSRTLARSRAISSSRSSAGRLLRAAWPRAGSHRASRQVWRR